MMAKFLRSLSASKLPRVALAAQDTLPQRKVGVRKLGRGGTFGKGQGNRGQQLVYRQCGWLAIFGVERVGVHPMKFSNMTKYSVRKSRHTTNETIPLKPCTSLRLYATVQTYDSLAV